MRGRERERSEREAIKGGKRSDEWPHVASTRGRYGPRLASLGAEQALRREERSQGEEED